jgi:Ca2+-binding RTX toxin-like protein
MTITGGAGNDTLQGGSGNDTITGGAGRDNLTGNNGNDVFVFSVGDSNPVASGGAGTSVGQDTVTFVEADDTIRLNVTSADNSWVLSTHVKLGTGGATTDDLALASSFTARTLLVQTGAVGGGTDAWDIAITKDSNWTNEATAQGRVSVNLTGTSVADTLTSGALADTVNGGTGNDTITGGTGNDSLTGGSGSDTFVFEATSNGSDTITDFTVGTDGDVLNLDAALGASAAVANSASGGVYVSPTATALATEGTSIAVGNRVLIINSGTTATTAYDTAAEVGALLADGGAWDAVDFAINTTGFLLVAANDGTRMLLIQVTNDGTAAVVESEITIVGTITIGADGIDGLVAGNFVLV